MNETHLWWALASAMLTIFILIIFLQREIKNSMALRYKIKELEQNDE